MKTAKQLHYEEQTDSLRHKLIILYDCLAKSEFLSEEWCLWLDEVKRAKDRLKLFESLKDD